MKFFIDNNLPPALAPALHELATGDRDIDVSEVIHVERKFGRETLDAEWLTKFDDEGDWVVLTQDRLRKSEAERRALKQCSMVVFILSSSWNDHNYWEKAERLIRWFPKLVVQAGLVGSGVFEVPWNVSGKGKLKVVQV